MNGQPKVTTASLVNAGATMMSSTTLKLQKVCPLAEGSPKNLAAQRLL
jgi:hypothetical protein